MQKNHTTLISLAIVATVIVLVVIAVARTLSGGPETADGQPDIAVAQPLEAETPYTDLDGNPVSLSEYEGKVLVVNAWATWCPFCVNELPDFAELANEFADQDVVVVAINRKEDPRRQQAFLETLENTGGITFWADDDDFFYGSVGGFTMPETVFYDKEGNEFFHKRGFMEISEMKDITNRVIAGG